ncbi:MAG: WhiB family transcriptional regulator [Jatrophihabitans sp.]|uniref:WhiB family transcriptional regulator n=1 Tax=Jatrophihabitans sp. TaxID=1932789 RepID=UPI003F808412
MTGDMSTGFAIESPSFDGLFATALGTDGLSDGTWDGFDPLAKDCPDDLPCRVEDAELWFAETPAELEQAKSFCAGCPARAVCLAGAIERREPWGVWGGEIFDRGEIIARKRPRGRPRKTDSTTGSSEVAA